jgi:signal transduction histidine kinase/Flp pilus assembly pilin Flp
MDEGRDTAMATALELGVVAGSVAVCLVLLTAPGSVLGEGLNARLTPVTTEVSGSLLAGLALVGAGASAILVRIRRDQAWLAVIVGVAWACASGRGLAHVPTFVPVVGAAVAPVVAVVLPAFAIVLYGRAPRRRVVGVLATTGAIGIALGAAALATYAPFFDPACVSTCDSRESVIELSTPARLLLARITEAFSLASGLATIAVAGWTLASRRGDTLGRRLMLAGCLVAGVALAGSSALALYGAGSAGPAGSAASLVAFLSGVGPFLIAIAVAWTTAAVVRLRMRIGRVGELVASTVDGSWQEDLAVALGDHSLEITYRLPDGSRFIDANGRPVAVPSAADRRITSVDRQGQPVAVIAHRAALDPDAVRAELTPQVLVALDNERLRAMSLSSLRTLRDSRARTVEIEDEERRRIERDLHDGAQQRVLAIAFELRLARTRAERAGDPATVDRLIHAEGLTFAALAELRRLARGVHPAILAQAGLAAALSSLAEESAVPMRLDIDRSRRLPPLIETTAYQVVAEALSDAAALDASEVVVVVSAAEANESVTLEIEFDGRTAAPYPVRISDRIGATGGSVSVDRPASDRLRIRAVMPCA